MKSEVSDIVINLFGRLVLADIPPLFGKIRAAIKLEKGVC